MGKHTIYDNKEKNMKKLIATVLLLSLLLCGCSDTVYEDTNGDENFKLQTITDEMIFGNHSGSQVSTGSQTLNKKFTTSGKKLNGVLDLYTFDALTFGEITYDLTVSFHVMKGNVKLIVCTLEKELLEIPANADDYKVTFTVSDEPVYIRIAGESCEYELSYTKESH